MKPHFLFLLALLVAGCGRTPELETPVAAPPVTAPAPKTYRYTGPEVWLEIMQVWRCDDGYYEVKTTSCLRGRYASLEEARTAKANWAIELAGYSKSMERVRVPECGTRIE